MRAMTRRLAVSLTMVSGMLLGCGSNGATTGADAGEGQVDTATSDAAPADDATSACATAEACDGVVDDDCDGTVDEGCGRCPLLSVTCTTGCCPLDSWQVDTSDALGADLAVAEDGTIFFAYSTPSSGEWTATLAIYDPAPGTWRKVPLGGGTYRNRVRIDAAGRIHVASAARSGAINYRVSSDGGHTFSDPVVVGTLDIGGVFDMEVDSTGAPHLAWSGDKPDTSLSDLRYARLDSNTWSGGVIDDVSGAAMYPDLALGFADRPHIVYEAYEAPGVAKESKRYIFYNGNQWIAETADAATDQQTYSADQYFAAHSLRIASDDSRELLFERSESNVATLYLARRGPGSGDPWQVTPVTGASGFTTSVAFLDAHGARGAVSDGLRLHREQGASWASTPLGVVGKDAAVARRGRYLYIAYRSGTGTYGKPTLTVIDLGP
jgi:hypothetical protein